MPETVKAAALPTVRVPVWLMVTPVELTAELKMKEEPANEMVPVEIVPAKLDVPVPLVWVRESQAIDPAVRLPARVIVKAPIPLTGPRVIASVPLERVKAKWPKTPPVSDTAPTPVPVLIVQLALRVIGPAKEIGALAEVIEDADINTDPDPVWSREPLVATLPLKLRLPLLAIARDNPPPLLVVTVLPNEMAWVVRAIPPFPVVEMAPEKEVVPVPVV